MTFARPIFAATMAAVAFSWSSAQLAAERIAPHGEWVSPLTAERLAAGTLTIEAVQAALGSVHWGERRPQEHGRTTVMRLAPGDAAPVELLPPPWNARTRVQEYGGGAWLEHQGTLWFSHFGDNRVYRRDSDGTITPLTPAGKWHYADFALDASRGRLLAVREEHSGAGREAVTTLVALPLAGGSAGEVLVSGADFYASPRLSPDGGRLAWQEWRHPEMPWDGNELWVAELGAGGRPEGARLLAGSRTEAIVQPEWSPAGELFFVSDRTGWWNLYRHAGRSAPAAVHLEAAEYGGPQWTLGASHFGIAADGRIAARRVERGQHGLVVFDRVALTPGPRDLPFTEIAQVRVDGGAVWFVGAAPQQAAGLVRMDLRSGERRLVRPTAEALPESLVAVAQPVVFPTAGGRAVAHAFFYPPRNPAFRAPAGASPPLLVFVHGGPTAQTGTGLRLAVQFWTSRGFAVLDVNYRGSTGFGTAYRRALQGEWGVADVEDAVAAARHVAALGWVDGRRMAIRGGSAGGFTALAALAFHDVFAAGASLFGVSDLALLARETHKFESRYLDSLVGPYPQMKDRYDARSPLRNLAGLREPVIFFQGLEDRIVPPGQSAAMHEALRRQGVTTAYLTFAGEGHGFRQAASIRRQLEAELAFYGVVFGFTPADPVEPVEIANPPRR